MKMQSFANILTIISVAHAVDICNPTNIKIVKEQPQFPSVPKLQDQSYWLISITEDDASYYNAASMKIDFGNYSSETDSTSSSITVARPDGITQVIPFDMKEKSSYMQEIQYDGEYEAHPFICSKKLTANYRCLTGNAIRFDVSKPLLDIFVRTNYTREDVSDEELEACKQALRKVDPTAEFVDLAHPDQVKMKTCKETLIPENSWLGQKYLAFRKNYKTTYYC